MSLTITGFPSGATVDLRFFSGSSLALAVDVGSATLDAQGACEVTVVIPPDAPDGDAEVAVQATSAGGACASQAYLVVVPSFETIAIDDDTVVPGQRVTITASGFARDSGIGVYLDSDPEDGLCR